LNGVNLSPQSKKVLFALLVVLLCLLALEGVARIVERTLLPPTVHSPSPGAPHDPHYERTLDQLRKLRGVPMVEDPKRGWSLPYNLRIHPDPKKFFRTNSLGFRGEELGELQPGEVRLFILGDSSIFGHGVTEEELFAQVAAESLGKAWGRPVRVVNGAVPGHDSRQSLQTFQDHVHRVTPSWVIIGNLWSDIYKHEGTGGAVGVKYKPMRDSLRRIAVHRLLRRLLAPYLRSREVGWLHSEQDLGSSEAGSFPTRTSRPAYVENLTRMACEATRHGARTLFLGLPAPVDFNPAPAPATITSFRKAMASVAADQKAVRIDGPELFRKEGLDATAFLDHVHPSPFGHAALGRELARVLKEAGPPPAGKSRYALTVGHIKSCERWR